MSENNFLPIATLNKLVYCPRRFHLMYVQGELAINAPMLEGSLQHERANTPGHEQDDRGRTAHRRIWVWHDDLNIAGFADFVEEATERKSKIVNRKSLIPVEYKHGRKGKWDNDQVQLCAQALCLEQMTGQSIPKGEIFYWRSRRRISVPFDQPLRDLTLATITHAHQLRAQHTIPPPTTEKHKCKHCSLEPICLPNEVRRLVNRKS